MSLRRYLKPVSKLPTVDQAGLPANVPKEVNQAVATTLERDEASPGKGSKKRKYTTTFTPEDHAAIGRYAAENGNAAAVRKFKATHSVGERTVRLKYLEEIKKQQSQRPDTMVEVRSVPVCKCGSTEGDAGRAT